MNNIAELDHFWVSVDDLKYFRKFSHEDVGGGLQAAFAYAFDHITPNGLSAGEQKVFNRLKKRVDDTRNGFDPYAQ